VKNSLRMTILAAAVWAAVAPAGAWLPFEVFPSADEQQSPDIDGNTVVWQQLITYQGNADWDIYGADISDPASPQVFAIANYPNDEQNPAIQGDFVAWEDNYYGDWDIYFRDISQSGRREVLLTNLPYDQTNPAVYGNMIVWQDNTYGDWDIAGANVIDPNSLFYIASFPDYDQTNCTIYRDMLVWQDNDIGLSNPKGKWNIVGADILRLDKPKWYELVLSAEDKVNVAIAGDYIVWQELAGTDWDLWAADITNPDEPQLLPIAVGSGTSMNPDIDGNIIVWQDDLNGDWDVYGYNLTTREEFIISDNQPGQQVFSDQTNPRISGRTVVWQDNLGGAWGVYAVVLDGPEAARRQARLPGDADGNGVVNMADLALVAQSWLTCNLDPVTACP